MRILQPPFLTSRRTPTRKLRQQSAESAMGRFCPISSAIL
jgi:hypothetical protein